MKDLLTKMLSTVAMTLLVALLCLVAAVFMKPYVPGFVDPALSQIAAAAWLSGMVSWMLAVMMRRRDQTRMVRAMRQGG